MQLLNFTKMHGLGNDFLIVNATQEPRHFSKDLITELCNRHIGVGCDQLIVIQPSEQADFFCRIYNADGSEAEQCGNGLRCVARLVHEDGIHPHKDLTIATISGVFALQIEDYNHIRATMGVPAILSALTQYSGQKNTDALPLSLLSLGNPHAILRVEDINTLGLTQLGAELSTATSLFATGANVGFMQIVNEHHIRLRTYERGVGETHACGSNACAAAVAGMINGWLNQQVQVEFRFGSLTIQWDGEGPIQMIGPATRVFSGEVNFKLDNWN